MLVRLSLICLGVLFLSRETSAVIDGKEVTKNIPADAETRAALSPVVKITLRRNDGKTGECTGTVIEKKPPLILTAEHCTEGKTVTKLVYRDANLEPIEVEARVRKVHQMGRRNQDDQRRDVAILELEMGEIPATAGEAFFPVTNCPVLDSEANDKMLITGYGANEVHIIGLGSEARLDPERPPSGGGTLRFGRNRAVQVDKGLITFNGVARNGNPPVALNASVGPGDSGGPVFARQKGKYYVAGIHSYLDRLPVRTPNGQVNVAVDACDQDVGKFVVGVFKEASGRLGGRLHRAGVGLPVESGEGNVEGAVHR